MAVTPIQDITVIKAIIEQDAYMNRIGYTSKNIFRYNQLDEEITPETKNITIYLAPSPPRNAESVFVECIYGIEVVSTKSNIGDVSNAVGQINALLHNRDIGNSHVLELYDPPTQLYSPKGTIRYYLSFRVLTSMYNAVKE